MDINNKEEEILNNKEAEDMDNHAESADMAENADKNADVSDSEDADNASEENELEKANAKIAELSDKYIRLVAEFDNYRKRVMREKAELIRNGGERIVTAILPVLDDMERAEQNMDKAEDVAAVKEGVTLIIEKFMKLLKHEGLEKIEAVGADFDTDFHEAIAMVPGQPDEMKGKVLDCVMNGYTLNEKVIRHAKVAVAQ
ncbi:MAG: nucleotide exchange factor GrpE [Bacteroides sp.]|nr:nucleotide exchange factor GrpE [Roseburia sp.]MCM1345587.1 nucleotide exchange factor GrpE [Bacteroides sp.]MCM1421258.1 nucleotide exchange factor GrpE [Bacteroides sp.]